VAVLIVSRAYRKPMASPDLAAKLGPLDQEPAGLGNPASSTLSRT
jgi:hypothetical protein